MPARPEETPAPHRLSGLRRRLTRTLAHLGPRGLLILACGLVWWVVLGVGTIADHAGTPESAPHLLIDHTWRGWAWIVTGLVAASLAIPRRTLRGQRSRHSTAVALLWVMPCVRALSYTWSWVVSWSWLDALIPDHPLLVGSPAAGYGSSTWWLMLLLLLAIAWCPASWRSLALALARDRAREAAATQEVDD